MKTRDIMTDEEPKRLLEYIFLVAAILLVALIGVGTLKTLFW